MDPSQENDSKPAFTFPDDSGRPLIQKYTVQLKFRPNDQVYICGSSTTTKQGPFTVMSLDGNLYKLCDSHGQEVDGGKSFEEKDLELYDPFE